MSKHERAVELVRQKAVYWRAQADALRQSDVGRAANEHAEAWERALWVLEAVEGVEEWMVNEVHRAWLFGNTGDYPGRWPGLLQIRSLLQAILDAKSDDA